MSSDSRHDSPAGDSIDGSSILAGCGIDVTDNGNGTVTIAADLPDIIGASGPAEAQNGLIVTPAGAIEPGQCRHLEVSPGNGIQIDSNERVAVDIPDFAGAGLVEAPAGILAVGAGDGIAVAADSVAVDLAVADPGLEFSGGDLKVKSIVRTRQAVWDKVPDAAATTATSERPFFYNDLGATLTLTLAILVVGSTHVGNDTNNFVIVVRKRDAAGAATTILTYTNNVASGGVTAWVPKNMGMGAATLATGESLTVEITKNGTGATLNGPCVTISFTFPG